MQRKIKIAAGATVATAACVGVALPAYAATNSSPHHHSGKAGDHHARGGIRALGLTPKVIAKDAGTDVKGLQAGRKAGKSLVQIAATHGVSRATLLSRLDTTADARVAKLINTKLPTGKAGKHPAARTWAKHHGVGGELKTVASTLKLTPAQLTADLKKGQTLAQIANAQHVSTTTLRTALDKVVDARIAKAADAVPHAKKATASPGASGAGSTT